MGKYSDDAKKLLEYVGGKQNISAVTHCMTRMRFVLADPEKADVAKIEALKSVKGTFTQAGQFRSEERRVGKECRIGCRSRWSPYH